MNIFFVHWYRVISLLLCFMVSSQLKKLIEQETRGEDIPQGQCADTPEICLPVTFVTLFSVKKTKLLALELHSSNEGLSGFPEFGCQIKIILQRLYSFANIVYYLRSLYLCVLLLHYKKVIFL